MSSFHVFLCTDDFYYVGAASSQEDAAALIEKAEQQYERGELVGTPQWEWATHRAAGQDWRSPPTSFKSDEQGEDDDVDWVGDFFIWEEK